MNKFRVELNKSQSIISKELIRSKELNLKFLKKRKKQQAEEEAKQLLIKNSAQNLNLINIQNNIINNSTGFKYKTSANFNDSLATKKNETPIKLNVSGADNAVSNTNSLKMTNNTKEDFFATEVKVGGKSNLKNPFSPMKDKKIDKSFNMNNVNVNNSNPATSRNSVVLIHNDKVSSEINQNNTPREYLSNLSNKK